MRFLFPVLPVLTGILLILSLQGHAIGHRSYLYPDTATVLNNNLYQVTFVIGTDGVGLGGELQVQFPTGFEKPQLTVSKEKDFVAVHSTNNAVDLELTVSNQDNIVALNKLHWTTSATVTAGALAEGDSVIFYFGKDTITPQYFGFGTSRFSGLEPLFTAVSNGLGEPLVRLSDIPIMIYPGKMHRVEAIGRSNPLLGETFKFTLIAMDRVNNPALFYTGTVEISQTDGITGLPASYTFQPSDSGIRSFNIQVNDQAVHRVLITDTANGIRALSNPMVVATNNHRIWWGDPHTHSLLSQHGRGWPEDLLRYGRDVTCLDWVAYTEHHYIAPVHLTEALKWSNAFNKANEFVTINGFEWSYTLYGHKCVYYPGDTFAIFDQKDPVGLFWDTRSQKGFVSAAHPSGLKSNGQAIMVTDWNYYDPEVQVNTEITGNSGWHFEYPDKQQYGNGGQIELVAGTTIREVLARNYRFGFLGSSDNHHSRPGRHPAPEDLNKDHHHTTDLDIGLTAVMAPSLTRSDIFHTMKQRLNYATTGERILVDFHLDSLNMGEAVPLDLTHLVKVRPHLFGSIHGTDTITSVQIIRNNSVFMEYFPNSLDFSFELKDSTFLFLAGVNVEPRSPLYDTLETFDGKNVYYYLRITQVKGSMAWSSPIWLLNGEQPEPITNPLNLILQSEHLAFNVFPNPNRGSFFLQYQLLIREPGMEISVYNTGGQLVLTQHLADLEQGMHAAQFTLPNASPGVYLIQLRGEKHAHYAKMVVY